VSLASKLRDTDTLKMHCWNVETANRGFAEPRSNAERKVGEPRANTDLGRRDCRTDGFPTRPQNVRDGRGDRDALHRRLRLARRRPPRPSRRHRDARRGHSPRQRAPTGPLSKRQYRARRYVRPRRDHAYRTSRARARHPTNSSDTPTVVLPHIGPHSAASPHRRAPWRPRAFDEHAAPEEGNVEWGRAPRDFVARHAAILRPRWHGHRHAG